MIVSLHVAAGGAAGALVRSRPLAAWPGGQKVFHSGDGRHGTGLSATAQLLAAGTVLGLLLGRRR